MGTGFWILLKTSYLGYYRQYRLWPLVPFLLYAASSSGEPLGRLFEREHWPQLAAQVMMSMNRANLLIVVLVGLLAMRHEKVGKIELREKSCPVSVYMRYGARVLALLTYSGLLMSCAMAILCSTLLVIGYKYGSLPSLYRDEAGCRAIMDLNSTEILAPEAIAEHEDLAVVTLLKRKDGTLVPALRVQKIEGSSQDELLLRCERKALLALKTGIKSVKIPRWVQLRGESVEVIVRKVYIRRENHSLLLSVGRAYLHLLVALIVVGVVTNLLGSVVSMECGLFFIAGLVLVCGIFQILDDNAVIKTAIMKENATGQSLINRPYWWESPLLKTTRVSVPVERLWSHLKRTDPLKYLEEGHVVPLPLSSLEEWYVIAVLMLMLVVAPPISDKMRT
ncbi:MAG: hypothetical protein HQL31_00455 [Planctomycetes bacterium]|nr:hypothetical protein [Planctomycetota bacterium]